MCDVLPGCLCQPRSPGAAAFIAPGVSGFLLVGPLFAADLCELSRRRAAGRLPLSTVRLILVGVGFATFLVGMVVIFPLLGHAT